MLIEGPQILLEPDAAQAIAVMLHELATNASKYGALSDAKGQIRLTWSRSEDEQLALRWTELGGPRVNEPERKGFGSRLIEGTISQLGGKARFDWRFGRACLRDRCSDVKSYPNSASLLSRWQLLLLCRFSDAGMTRLSTRCGGRRPKSANARSRGSMAPGSAASAMGIVCWWRSRWWTRREQNASTTSAFWHERCTSGFLMFLARVISNGCAWQKQHIPQPLRD